MCYVCYVCFMCFVCFVFINKCVTIISNFVCQLSPHFSARRKRYKGFDSLFVSTNRYELFVCKGNLFFAQKSCQFFRPGRSFLDSLSWRGA